MEANISDLCHCDLGLVPVCVSDAMWRIRRHCPNRSFHDVQWHHAVQTCWADILRWNCRENKTLFITCLLLYTRLTWELILHSIFSRGILWWIYWYCGETLRMKGLVRCWHVGLCRFGRGGHHQADVCACVSLSRSTFISCLYYSITRVLVAAEGGLRDCIEAGLRYVSALTGSSLFLPREHHYTVGCNSGCMWCTWMITLRHGKIPHLSDGLVSGQRCSERTRISCMKSYRGTKWFHGLHARRQSTNTLRKFSRRWIR